MNGPTQSEPEPSEEPDATREDGAHESDDSSSGETPPEKPIEDMDYEEQRKYQERLREGDERAG